MKYWALPIIAILISIATSTWVFYKTKHNTGFVYTKTVFSNFEGTKHLQKKMESSRIANKRVLDSIGSLINAGRKDLTVVYDQKAEGFRIAEKEATDKYNSEIWQFINKNIKLFGEQNDYEFIYGANGDGNLMYAPERKDVTDEVTKFVNKQYLTK